MLRLRAILCGLLLASPAVAQEPVVESAPVEVDGDVLFRVRGIQALPAAKRAADIAARVRALAADRAFRPESLRVEERGEASLLLGGQRVVMVLIDEDASIEGVRRSLLAPAYAERVRRAIVEYRDARTRARLATSATRAAAAVAIAVVLLAVILALLKRGEAAIQRAFGRRVEAFATDAARVERLWQSVRGAVGLLRVTAVLVVALLLLQYVLVQFPWTRGAGLHLLGRVGGPLTGLGQGFVDAIPNLVVLAIILLVTRYGLLLAGLYFAAVERGRIQVRDFEPEWAQPTYNLVRLGGVAAAVVIAYPYIPGSHSDAFKGISILAGVLLSLGSSSAIANIVAGYMLLYRRAFRVGDVVTIGDVNGRVMEMRLQVAHVRTAKNEEITIPNSAILTSEVVNFSRPAREGKLILHTEVGIGYGTPWRQVEAMLIAAARRTPGVTAEPPPFVLQRKLGEFAVTYEINAHTDRPGGYLQIYADLHRNILDEFNEHGVQIMTPAYEGDPEIPKIVAKEQWYPTPARQGATSEAPEPSRTGDGARSATDR